VDPRSNTETYAALRLFVENWRWADVPFYLRTGKRLAKHLTQVVIRFKRTPLMLFGEKSTAKPGRTHSSSISNPRKASPS
jgi:glucose-6-phosphate 1-dehydrogenase